MTTTSKQRSIRFDDGLQEQLEQMAREEDRTFSAQVVSLVKEAIRLKRRSHGQHAA